MPKVKLDAAFCSSAACEPGRRRTDYWCTRTVGHVLECRSSGGKTHYVRYFDQSGRQRQVKLGNHEEVSHAQAAKAARRVRAEVMLGGDTASDKKAKRAVPTYAVLAEQHLEYARNLKSYSSLETIVRVHLVPRWGKLRLDEITPQAIARWLDEKGAEGLMPATREKLRTCLGRSFALAARWSMSGAEKNPVRLVEGLKFDNRRERYLSAEEAARLLDAAGRSLNPQLRPIVALLLLTGARISELLHAKWCHVDLDRRSWHLPITKTKQRFVPLSDAAVEIIE